MKKFLLFSLVSLLFSLLTATPAPLPAQTVPPDPWTVKGNIGISAPTNFIGNIDAQPLVFKTDNIERARIDAQGNFSIDKHCTPVTQLFSTTVPNSSGVFYYTSTVTGTLNLSLLQQKGRYFTICNYSTTAISLPNNVICNQTPPISIPAGQCWALIWSGSNWIRF